MNKNMETKINKTQADLFTTSDLKLSAFLRLMSSRSFVGINKSDTRRVLFVFQRTSEITQLVEDYLQGKVFELSPLNFANLIDQNKQLVFGDFEL